MIGPRLGAYRLLSELGAGGMGTVHAAEVAEAVPGLAVGERVAVKVVHPHLLSTPGFFKRFLREAEMGRKVVHENVVRTFDVDAIEQDDRVIHYMVMEYVEGRSLRQLLKDLGTIPETLLREIALQTAAGLAAIHAQGIVHRDLKPANVLITDGHEIRIMDLGVAKLQEASIRLTAEGQFAGTMLYAAPEQFLGAGDVGPQADLYSLGVMLYELATGDNPFRAVHPGALMAAQLKLEPPRISDRTTGTTAFFAELVAKLLAKNPADRFESAAALHAVLAEGERSPWWRELEPKLRLRIAHLPRIRVRRETEPRGRDGDLQTLHEAWARAKAGEGNTVFFEGEAGIGKTRLLDAFLRGLDDKDFHVLYGSYPPSGGLGGISDAVLDRFGEANLAGALAPYLSVTPTLVPAFAALVQHASPPTDAEPLQGDALHAVCVHLMRALAEEKPLIWLVEDLHFAPKDSRDTVLALARAVEGHRVLLVGTARPGVPDDELANFSRLENYQRMNLSRLGAREVMQLLQDAFKSETLAEQLGVKIALKSDGVPFFIFEMIRELKEAGFIQQLDDGRYVQMQVIREIEVPSAVKDLIEGRLRGLTESQRAILDAGAVQGMAFDPALVARIVEEKRVRVLRELAEVERRHGLVRGEAGLTRFDQNQIQEVVYQDLTPDLRSEYHALLAEAYGESRVGDPKGEDAVFLASHHLRGSRPEKGLAHLTPALEHLQKSYRNEAAIELAARALETPRLLEGKERVEVLLRKAGRHGLRGEQERQRAALDEAFAVADQIGEAALQARACWSLGTHLVGLSDYAAGRGRIEQAIDLARQAGDTELEVRATGSLGNVFLYESRYEEARATFEDALAHAREIGDGEGESMATGNLATVFRSVGRYEEARVHVEHRLARSRESGDRLVEAVATGNLADIVWNLGRHEEARAHMERHLALSREIGYRRGEANANGNLGAMLAGLGRYEDAIARLEIFLALSREIGNRRGEALATGNLGGVLSFQGRYEEARTYIEKHLALAREIADRTGEASALGNLGQVFFSQGRHEEARAHIEQHLALAREIGDRRQEGYALSSLGSLADAEGDAGAALRLHGEALALRRELGERGNVAYSLVALGGIEGERGDNDRATAHLEEALELAREVKAPGTLLLASVYRARLPGGDKQAGLSALEEHEERADHETRMKARFRLWELTKDQTHLENAHRLLGYSRDHAPEECRDSMIENVPLHRDIMKAWDRYRYGRYGAR
ncbi:MAG: serine/threonine-protein kinase [Planctomycetota bacterium]